MNFLGFSDQKITKEETVLWAKRHGSTFTSIIKAKEVGKILRAVDAMAKKDGVDEQAAMGLVVDILELDDSERKEEDLKIAAMMLLWAACRCPAGKTARKAARKGGKSIGFDISKSDSEGGFTYGLHVDDLKQRYIPLPPAGHA